MGGFLELPPEGTPGSRSDPGSALRQEVAGINPFRLLGTLAKSLSSARLATQPEQRHDDGVVLVGNQWNDV